MSSSPGAGTSTMSRILKCFCGCSELSAADVIQMYQLTTQGTLSNDQARNLFRNFIQSQKTGDDKPKAERFLEISEFCESCIREGRSLSLKDVKTLDRLGLSYQFTKQLKIKIKSEASSEEIELTLRQIQENCAREIEVSEEYTRYKDALLKKYKSASDSSE